MDRHLLPDVLAPGLRVVFCGTAAGRESARAEAYYAYPQNRFWGTLYEARLTPRRLAPAEYMTVLNFGIGLTDIAKQVSGMDHQLPAGSLGRDPCAALRVKIEKFAPKILAFTSLNAGRRFLGRAFTEVGEQPERIGETRIWVLPSTSPAATNHWKKTDGLNRWKALGEAAAE